MRLALVLSAVALAAAGAILLNLALLRGPSNDPVGKLSPRAAVFTTPVAPPPPQSTTVEHEADD